MAEITGIVFFVVTTGEDGNGMPEVTIRLKAADDGKVKTAAHQQKDQRQAPQKTRQRL